MISIAICLVSYVASNRVYVVERRRVIDRRDPLACRVAGTHLHHPLQAGRTQSITARQTQRASIYCRVDCLARKFRTRTVHLPFDRSRAPSVTASSINRPFLRCGFTNLRAQVRSQAGTPQQEHDVHLIEARRNNRAVSRKLGGCRRYWSRPTLGHETTCELLGD